MNSYEKVKEKAIEQGKAISTIEKEAGIANGTIGGWKKSKPLAETLYKVAKAIKTPMEELI